MTKKFSFTLLGVLLTGTGRFLFLGFVFCVVAIGIGFYRAAGNWAAVPWCFCPFIMGVCLPFGVGIDLAPFRAVFVLPAILILGGLVAAIELTAIDYLLKISPHHLSRVFGLSDFLICGFVPSLLAFLAWWQTRRRWQLRVFS